MKPLFSYNKQKWLSVLLASAVTLLSFEALSFILGQTYQLGIYGWVSFYIYLFHFLWLTFLFDLHFKKKGVLEEALFNYKGMVLLRLAFKERVAHIFNWHYFRHYSNFLILPGVIYWSAVILMALNPFDTVLKQSLIALSTIFLGIAYWHFKEIFNKNLELHQTGIKILAVVKILAAFMFYSASIGLTYYFDLGPVFLCFVVFAITLLLLYQALFQHKLMSNKIVLSMIAIAAVVTVTAFLVYLIWDYKYLTAALVLTAVYNAGWGMLHHHLDRNLTQQLVLEYLLILAVVLSILLASHDFAPRVQ